MIDLFAIIGLATIIYMIVGVCYAVWSFVTARDCGDPIPSHHFVRLVLEWPFVAAILRRERK